MISFVFPTVTCAGGCFLSSSDGGLPQLCCACLAPTPRPWTCVCVCVCLCSLRREDSPHTISLAFTGEKTDPWCLPGAAEQSSGPCWTAPTCTQKLGVLSQPILVSRPSILMSWQSIHMLTKAHRAMQFHVCFCWVLQTNRNTAKH